MPGYKTFYTAKLLCDMNIQMRIGHFDAFSLENIVDFQGNGLVYIPVQVGFRPNTDNIADSVVAIVGDVSEDALFMSLINMRLKYQLSNI